jgi:hypothetical protein
VEVGSRLNKYQPCTAFAKNRGFHAVCSTGLLAAGGQISHYHFFKRLSDALKNLPVMHF